MLKTLATILALVIAAPAAAQGISFPVHGNWCGPGHGGGPGPYGGAPLDLLDAACMRHDYCVLQTGAYNCTCDLMFMDELRAVPWPNPGLAEKARAVHEAIAMVPCQNPAGQTAKMERIFTDWMNGVASGYEAPWDVIERLGNLFEEGMQRAY